MLTAKQLLDVLLKLPKEQLDKHVGFPDTRRGSEIIQCIVHVELSKNVAFSIEGGGVMYTDVVVLY